MPFFDCLKKIIQNNQKRFLLLGLILQILVVFYYYLFFDSSLIYFLVSELDLYLTLWILRSFIYISHIKKDISYRNKDTFYHSYKQATPIQKKIFLLGGFFLFVNLVIYILFSQWVPILFYYFVFGQFVSYSSIRIIWKTIQK